MRHTASFIALAFVLLVCRGAWGAPDAPEAAPSAPDSTVAAPASPVVASIPESAPESPGIEPLKKGAPAPFTGLLVPETRYVEFLEAENRALELATKLASKEDTARFVEAVYLKKLDQATAPIPWHEGAMFNWWFGFGSGVAATVAAIWGATEIIQKTK